MIRRSLAFVLPSLAASLLHAQIPSSVLFQGYLTDNGTPLSGAQTLLVKACDAVIDGNCKTVYSGDVQANNGYYSALLQNLPTMDKPYWLEVSSNGSLLPNRIALTATPYALRAAVSDSAPKALRADSATGALRAASAINATNATNAVNAMNATNATLAAKATLADSTTGALRAASAINAINATNAVNAMNATNATLAAKATLADSATGALRAASAINAINATTAASIIGGHVSSLNGIQGSATLAAGTNISLVSSGSTLTINGPSSVSSATNAKYAETASNVNSLQGTVSTTYVQLNYHPYSTDLGTCDASKRGRLYMCADPSAYTADVPCWCQYFSNPGGEGYRWVYLDYGMFQVR